MRIGITGAKGLLGWHLSCFLNAQGAHTRMRADRDVFESATRLQDFVASSEAIVHFAGMNRGDDELIEEVNIRLVDQIIDACRSVNAVPHILFSSSTHVTRDTAYARSKRACAEKLQTWAKAEGSKFTNVVIPNVFGEGGKPFYNSVVSTFCHQLANGQRPQVLSDVTNELIHAQGVCAQIGEFIESGETGEKRLTGTPLSVSALLKKIDDFDQSYRGSVIPDLRDSFDLSLFNTYRSYLYPDYYPIATKLHIDDRGSLFEAVKSLNGGQTFISTTKPGITRGNHYHLKKIERFLVLKGEAKIQIRRLFSDEIKEFAVSGREPVIIDIPTLHTHNITNTGHEELTTLFWAHEIFNPASPDTFAEPV
jgi:UDP-2-acetamido-2,6-beta-L-arabino-hexul-4-ose reductase